MSGTVEQFSRLLLDHDAFRESLDPERLATVFVRHFNLSDRPALDELKALMERARFGAVEEWEMDGLKGAHIGRPRGRYRIYCRGDLWEGTKVHTLLHEAYEIVMETMCDLHSDSPPQRRVCREADRFAAAALMQPEEFSRLAQNCGLDVIALQREYGCSYASVTIRLAEVLRNVPLMAILYGSSEQGAPPGWAAPPALRAVAVKRTRGFGASHSPLLCGVRGGLPAWDRPLPPGSLAELAALSGMAEYAEEDGLAVIARPVLWRGRLAKVSIVAVPHRHRAVLEPQLLAPDFAPRSRHPVAAGPG